MRYKNKEIFSPLRWNVPRVITRFIERASAWTVLGAVRSGLVLTLPLVMLGSFAILLNNFPVRGYQEFMLSLFGPGWRDFGGVIWQGTFGIMALISLCSISYCLAEKHNRVYTLAKVNPLISGLVCVASVISLLPVHKGGISLEWTGSAGLFASIIVAVLASHLFLRLSRCRALRLDVFGGNVDFAVPQAFNAIVPGAVTITLFALLGLTVKQVSGLDAHEAIYALVRTPFELVGEGLWRAALYVLSLDGLWFFGIHGANVLDPVTQQVYHSADAANLAVQTAWEVESAVRSAMAALNGLPAQLPPRPKLPNELTKNMLDAFVFMGGSGCTLSLALAILLGAKDRGQKRLAGISLAPGLFNINEILLFGLPVVLNPVLFIPFLLTPLILLLVSHAAISLGLVSVTTGAFEWTTPIFLSGYLVSGSVAGAVLQLVNLFLGVAIYTPFIRLGERLRAKRTRAAFDELFDRACNINTQHSSQRCLGYHDEAGALAHGLLADLEKACRGDMGLYLEYQPQMHAKSRKPFGAEALLRWKHPQHGPIPAPITVALAEEGGLIGVLGLRIFEEACATRKLWLDMGLTELIMAINVSALQLKPGFVEQVKEIITRYALPPYLLEVEVTESSALDPESGETAILQELHGLGLRLAIDDFGMGHSSLKYLKQFPVEVVKIDGAITNEITSNPICADIVLSITRLCRARDIISIVEFVETEEQVEILLRHGCDVFQGYLFSRSLPEGECREYFLRNA